MGPKKDAMTARRCCLCGDGAVATFVMPGGCVARPDLVTQSLCVHHAVRATPLGGMRMIADHTGGGEFGRWWRDRQ